MFLQIIGGICLAGVAVAVVGYLVLRWRLRRMLAQLEQATPGGGILPPSRITLEPFSSSFFQEAPIEAATRDLQQLGFAVIGDYQISELGVELRALTHPDRCLYAVVYNHSRAGVWVDLWQRYQDGQRLTVSNAPSDDFESRPGCTKWTFPGEAVDTLWTHFQQASITDAEPAPAPASDFVEVFESEYRQATEWMATRGGVTREEIERVAAREGYEVDESVITRMLDQSRLEANAVLSEKVREQFLDSGQISAAQWDRVQDGFLVIHDQMTLPEVHEALYNIEQGDIEEDRLTAPPDMSAREQFAMLYDRLSRPIPIRKLGSVWKPVSADCYFVDWSKADPVDVDE